MAIVPSPRRRKVHYPTGDGKPVAESVVHRENLFGFIEMLRDRFAGDATVYISGNMFIYYVEGDRRKHVSPDIFVTLGIGDHYRDAYFVWEEGKGPDFVVELTSPTTRNEDLEKKYQLYRDVLKVREYFLFDPKSEYLQPPLQGFRLIDGQYVRIESAEGGGLPSEVLGVQLVKDGSNLRLYDPRTGERSLTTQEKTAARHAERRRAEEAEHRAEVERQRAEAAETEIERLRAELEALRRQPPGSGR